MKFKETVICKYTTFIEIWDEENILEMLENAAGVAVITMLDSGEKDVNVECDLFVRFIAPLIAKRCLEDLKNGKEVRFQHAISASIFSLATDFDIAEYRKQEEEIERECEKEAENECDGFEMPPFFNGLFE